MEKQTRTLEDLTDEECREILKDIRSVLWRYHSKMLNKAYCLDQLEYLLSEYRLDF